MLLPNIKKGIHLISWSGLLPRFFVGAYESVIIGTTLQKTDFKAGAVFGILTSAYVMTKWGRKFGLVFGCVISLAGLAGMTGSMNYAEFLVFCFISGFGTWQCGAAGEFKNEKIHTRCSLTFNLKMLMNGKPLSYFLNLPLPHVEVYWLG
ncbi:general substrate transporter [Penicillium malachiteum]|uniref:general substrate transporter n=1 Tax=Penicillium malachiteum TaxID=1324776 RepID=UPI0025481643|nr:general substrate transporter [Penicillium malachiteum]KAJ5734896.1 general substrate transporter [Penicillium malachiteum]